jgi:hypothetical protein
VGSLARIFPIAVALACLDCSWVCSLKDVGFVYGQQTCASTLPGSLLEAIMRHGLAWLLDHGEGDSEEARIAGKHWTKIRWLTRVRSAQQYYQGLQQRTMLNLLDRGILLRKMSDHFCYLR